ncbi:MAG: DUF1996 domain-containing protein [Nakamurella sp.]
MAAAVCAMLLSLFINGSADASFGAVSKRSSSFPEKVSWVTVCSVSSRASLDPIVYPGQPGAGHEHTFSGALNVDAFSTAESLQKGTTNCTNSGDHAAYWMPTLYSDGKAVVPYTTRVYYRAGTYDTARVQPVPFGLKMVAGSAMAIRPQDAGIAGFHCREEGSGPTVSKQALPPTCPAGSLFEASVQFPNCWDGVHLDSSDHRSHMSYAKDYKCDAAHPVMIPQVTMAERFAPGVVDGSTVTLAAMPGMKATNLTLHADFLNAWDPELMKRLLRDCIRAGVACEGVSDKRMPPVTAN